jgi:hypothetical protein
VRAPAVRSCHHLQPLARNFVWEHVEPRDPLPFNPIDLLPDSSHPCAYQNPSPPLRFSSVFLTLEPLGCSESCTPRRHCRRQTLAILVTTDRLGFLCMHHSFYFIQAHLPDMITFLLMLQDDEFILYWISPSATTNSGERLPRNQTTSASPTLPSNSPHHSEPPGKALARGTLFISRSHRCPKPHCHTG